MTTLAPHRPLPGLEVESMHSCSHHPTPSRVRDRVGDACVSAASSTTPTRPARRVGSLVALAMAALLLVPGAALAQAGEVDHEAIDEIFGAWDSTRSPGCAVAATRGGDPILSRAYGMSDLEHGIPNTPSTIFEAGSVSKQFAAAAIALLALEGALSFDDDVREYVPELPDYGETIRIHHLLNHTSGLRDWGSVAAISGWGRSARTHNHDHVLEIAARQSALNYPPGEAYSYTNTGYNLMAVIVERVSGLPFAEFSKERIFEPLGLIDTQWRDDYRRIVIGRAAAYAPSGDGFRIDRPIEDVHGNGGLLTTVRDLLVWDEALRNGTFHGEEFTELMHRQGVLTNGRTIAYASGLFVDERRGLPYVSHTGATSGYRAFLGRYPDQELAVALLCNVTNANPGGLGNQVSDALLGEVADPEAPATPEGIEIPSADLRRLAGLYVETETGEPRRLVFDDGTLRQGNTPLVPLSEREFQLGSGGTILRFDAPAGEGRSAFEAFDDGYEDGRFEPTEAADPEDETLRGYVGRYHSDDAETTLEVRQVNGELVIHRRPSSTTTLSPIYPDAFQGGGMGLVRFHRNAAGAISELSLRQARVHDLRFYRLEDP